MACTKLSINKEIRRVIKTSYRRADGPINIQMQLHVDADPDTTHSMLAQLKLDKQEQHQERDKEPIKHNMRAVGKKIRDKGKGKNHRGLR